MSLLDQLRTANAAANITPPASQPPQAAATRRHSPPGSQDSPTAPQAAPQAPGSQSAQPTPASPCRCGFRTFWQDSYGNWSCQSCRPPKLAFMARRTVTLGSDGAAASEITAADESRYDKFIEVTGADGRLHTVHRDCLDPRSDYFDSRICQKISSGVEPSEIIFDSLDLWLRKIFNSTGSIDRLPGPWPANKQQENFSLSAESVNSSGEKKNKKSAARKPAARRGK